MVQKQKDDGRRIPPRLLVGIARAKSSSTKPVLSNMEVRTDTQVSRGGGGRHTHQIDSGTTNVCDVKPEGRTCASFPLRTTRPKCALHYR